LEHDPTDPDQQTLLFLYPSVISSYSQSSLKAWVKIELGARSDSYPVETGEVKPYLAEVFPGTLSAPATTVRVLEPRRTFWEKATILHMLYHLPGGKPFPSGMSRHYYDIFRLAKSPVLAEALNDFDLLDRVADHKSVFFKVAWARYDTARRGTLRLVPERRGVDSLRQDYNRMQPMFLAPPPMLDEILNTLIMLENRINRPEG
jgi:hypothetical protein